MNTNEYAMNTTMDDVKKKKLFLAMSCPVVWLLIRAAVTGLFFGIVWEAGRVIFQVPAYIIPSPLAVTTLISSRPAYFAEQSLVTCSEAIGGCFIALVLGFVSGLVVSFERRLGGVIESAAVLVQAIPLVVLAPIFVVWFGVGALSKVVLVALLCWFPIFVATLRGLQSPGRMDILLFRSLHADAWQTFSRLRLPGSVPFLAAGIRTSLGISMLGAIVAEYSGANAGLGYVITQSSYRLDTVTLFAAVGCAAFGGLSVYGLFSLFERIFLGRFFRSSG